MGEKCCPECFDDSHFRNEVFGILGASVGTCDFCGTLSVPVLEPTKLADYFEGILEVYEPSPEGLPLIDWLQQDWLLFPQTSLPLGRAKELLAQILNDAEVNVVKRVPAASGGSNPLSEWDRLREELKHSNRWFITNPLDTEWLEWSLKWTEIFIEPSTWYRARLQRGPDRFKPKQMGAPPREVSSHGRANPAGIPYLYLGSEAETAIAEVRPHTGDVVTVARFKTEKLKIADLISPRARVTPFNHDGWGNVRRLRRDLELLDCLGTELSRPVLPHNSVFDYVPSQYVCEFIKSAGYHGVRYSSALGEGVNLALFDPGKAKATRTSTYAVNNVSVGSSPLSPN